MADLSNRPTNASRSRRYRERRENGIVVAQVEADPRMLFALACSGLLKPESFFDSNEVGRAIGRLLEDLWQRRVGAHQ